jgi:hypothetical protein
MIERGNALQGSEHTRDHHPGQFPATCQTCRAEEVYILANGGTPGQRDPYTPRTLKTPHGPIECGPDDVASNARFHEAATCGCHRCDRCRDAVERMILDLDMVDFDAGSAPK